MPTDELHDALHGWYLPQPFDALLLERCWTYCHSLGGTSMVEKISAVPLRVANMRASIRFYKDVLGLEIIHGGEGSYFTSLRTKGGDTVLNLEHGDAGIRWGRLIFHVSDVDGFWAYLMGKGFHPDSPQDASWGERYFHMPDPDGHELSFARATTFSGQANFSISLWSSGIASSLLKSTDPKMPVAEV